jgi:hypothetical protein
MPFKPAPTIQGLFEFCVSFCLSLPKMLSGVNVFEISDIERMNIRAHQPGI